VTALLEIEGLRSGYGGGEVLRGVDLTVEHAETLGMLGRNGMGKSTLVMTLMGLVRASAGRVVFDGTDLTGARPDVVARAGLGLVPQGRRVFAPLTVEENLRIVAARRKGGPWTIDKIYELLPSLHRRRSNRADQLSGGEQQMLAIGRALLCQPRLLLLDEPSDGLAPKIVTQLTDLVRKLCTDGLTVLLVEQDLHAAVRCANRIAVMVRGEIQLDCSRQEFLSDRSRAHRLLGVG
jgi:branched-chain amino acid transport system ATP-binding protein